MVCEKLKGKWDALCARDRVQARIQALAYNTRWNMVHALSINNDNYKMGNKIWIYKIWYKLYEVWYDLLGHDYLQDLQAIQELFTSFIKVQDWLEHQGNKKVLYWMGNGWMRDKIVIDNGSVLVHKAPELPGFHQGTYPRHLNCQVFTIGRLFLFTFFVFFCFQKLGIPRIFKHRTSWDEWC